MLRREEQPAPFELFDEYGQPLGAARHLVLALGHAALAWPAPLAPWHNHPLVAHAYRSPVLRPGARVAVIGGGMAAAHLWIAAIQQGCQVVALHRRPLHRQALNAPRCAFSAAGIDAYRRLDPYARCAFHAAPRGSFPWRLTWEPAYWWASRSDMFAGRQTEVVRVVSSAGDTKLTLMLADGTVETVDQVICATGFRSSVRAHALIAQLADDYALPLIDDMLCIDDDFTLPALGGHGSVCGVIGVLARWALPIADTFAGMKYAARRLITALSLNDTLCASR